MIYLDHHATTPIDPGVIDAMLPWMTTYFGNPHSHTHEVGRVAQARCDQAIQSIAELLDVNSQLLVVTSGATESNNLAIDGVMRHPRQTRRHLITCATEHPSVLDPVRRLEREGFQVTILRVHPQGHSHCGQIDLDQLAAALSDQTALVSVMWANNEIGAIQPIKQIATLTHSAGALLHCDATQAVGRLPIDVAQSEIDLLSGSAHKFYGPKGIGFLAIGDQRRVRLRPLILGGGQQNGLRSGTVNVAGLVGMESALRLSIAQMPSQAERQRFLRDDLWHQLQTAFSGIQVNGPDISAEPENRCERLFNNLNFSFADIEGETMMAAAPELAISSGSACSSVDPSPSHVLLAIGLDESRARRSLRFGLGQSTTQSEIHQAVAILKKAHEKLVSI